MSKITNETIVKAKAENGEIFVLEVDMNELAELSTNEDSVQDLKIETAKGEFKAIEGAFYAVVKKPNKKVIGFAMTHRDPIQMGNAILKNCIVEADDEILENEDVNITAALQAMKFVQIGQGSIKKY